MAELIAEWVNRHFGCACTTRCGSLADLAKHDLNRVDMVMSDYNLPDGTGLDVLALVQGRREDLPVILVTGVREANTAVDAIRRGAYDYVMKVGDFARTIPVVIEKNLEVARIRRDNLRLQAALATSLAELKRKNRTRPTASSRTPRPGSSGWRRPICSPVWPTGAGWSSDCTSCSPRRCATPPTCRA